MNTYRFVKKTYCARILIEGARFPPFGFVIAEISSNSNEDVSFCQKDSLCPDSDRGRSVSPLGFDTAEISSNSNEDVSFCQKDLLCPDSDRGHSVSPLRVRYSGDKLEFERRLIVVSKILIVPVF